MLPIAWAGRARRPRTCSFGTSVSRRAGTASTGSRPALWEAVRTYTARSVRHDPRDAGEALLVVVLTRTDALDRAEALPHPRGPVDDPAVVVVIESFQCLTVRLQTLGQRLPLAIGLGGTARHRLRGQRNQRERQLGLVAGHLRTLPTAPRDPTAQRPGWLAAFGNLLRKTACCSASGKETCEFVRQPRQLLAVGFPGGGGQLEQ